MVAWIERHDKTFLAENLANGIWNPLDMGKTNEAVLIIIITRILDDMRRRASVRPELLSNYFPSKFYGPYFRGSCLLGTPHWDVETLHPSVSRRIG